MIHNIPQVHVWGNDEDKRMKIFVGNLSNVVKESDLKTLFGKYGHIVSVQFWKERNNNEQLFYSIVDMPVKRQALAAIEALRGVQINGVTLTIHPARVGWQNRRRQGRGGGRRRNDPPEKK